MLPGKASNVPRPKQFLIRLATNAQASPKPGPKKIAQSTFIRCCTGAHFEPNTGIENSEPITAIAANNAVSVSFFKLIFVIFSPFALPKGLSDYRAYM